MSDTIKQAQSRASTTAKGKNNRSQALSASHNGLTLQQAAQICGRKVSGFKSLLYREFGTTSWPINEINEGVSQ